MNNVKVIIEGKIKPPKIGDSYCGVGIAGRSGFFCDDIVRIDKKYLYLSEGDKIPIVQYYYGELMNKSNNKIKVTVYDK